MQLTTPVQLKVETIDPRIEAQGSTPTHVDISPKQLSFMESFFDDGNRSEIKYNQK